MPCNAFPTLKMDGVASLFASSRYCSPVAAINHHVLGLRHKNVFPLASKQSSTFFLLDKTKHNSHIEPQNSSKHALFQSTTCSNSTQFSLVNYMPTTR